MEDVGRPAGAAQEGRQSKKSEELKQELSFRDVQEALPQRQDEYARDVYNNGKYK